MIYDNEAVKESQSASRHWALARVCVCVCASPQVLFTVCHATRSYHNVSKGVFFFHLVFSFHWYSFSNLNICSHGYQTPPYSNLPLRHQKCMSARQTVWLEVTVADPSFYDTMLLSVGWKCKHFLFEVVMVLVLNYNEVQSVPHPVVVCFPSWLAGFSDWQPNTRYRTFQFVGMKCRVMCISQH